MVSNLSAADVMYVGKGLKDKLLSITASPLAAFLTEGVNAMVVTDM